MIMVKLFEIIRKFEELVPKALQWEKDNTGLQVGDPQQNINRILLSLELDSQILNEAKEKKADLILTHHPLLFKPLKKVDFSSEQGLFLKELIQNNIALYASHTNLDKYNKGVGFAFGKRLGLKNIISLVAEEDINYKIVTFVPLDYTEKVIEALSNAGAGNIGDYKQCSFKIQGKGTFEGSQNSNPFIGKKCQNESVDEIRVEMIFPKWRTGNIIQAVKETHPYEEPAFDIYPLKSFSEDTGLGVVGDLPEKTDIKNFLNDLKIKLNIPFLKTSNNLNGNVERIAVMPGAGNSYLQYAINNRAQVFITSDVTYHTYFEAMNKIILVDAGHFETEIPVLSEIEGLLSGLFNKDVEIIRTEHITNPIYYY
jgi:dinuclear metal center YbgI/SA1388 family protein